MPEKATLSAYNPVTGDFKTVLVNSIVCNKNPKEDSLSVLIDFFKETDEAFALVCRDLSFFDKDRIVFAENGKKPVYTKSFEKLRSLVKEIGRTKNYVFVDGEWMYVV